MSDAAVEKILAELAALKALVLERTSASRPDLAPAGDLSVEQFAQAIGRKPLYVYRRIASRQIAVRSGGKPYQIPADQVAKFRKPTRTI